MISARHLKTLPLVLSTFMSFHLTQSTMATDRVLSPCSFNIKPRLWQKSDHSIIKEITGNKLSQPNSEVGFPKGLCPWGCDAYFPS